MLRYLRYFVHREMEHQASVIDRNLQVPANDSGSCHGRASNPGGRGYYDRGHEGVERQSYLAILTRIRQVGARLATGLYG